jgi:hypothetical protein
VVAVVAAAVVGGAAEALLKAAATSASPSTGRSCSTASWEPRSVRLKEGGLRCGLGATVFSLHGAHNNNHTQNTTDLGEFDLDALVIASRGAPAGADGFYSLLASERL